MERQTDGKTDKQIERQTRKNNHKCAIIMAYIAQFKSINTNKQYTYTFTQIKTKKNVNAVGHLN